MSEQFSLNKEDGLKIAKGAGIAVTGALLTYLAGVLPDVNFGQYQMVLFPLFSTLVHTGLKYFEGE